MTLFLTALFYTHNTTILSLLPIVSIDFSMPCCFPAGCGNFAPATPPSLLSCPQCWSTFSGPAAFLLDGALSYLQYHHPFLCNICSFWMLLHPAALLIAWWHSFTSHSFATLPIGGAVSHLQYDHPFLPSALIIQFYMSLPLHSLYLSISNPIQTQQVFHTDFLKKQTRSVL